MVFKVKFWGVRGSIACPLPSHMTFGGNTRACVCAMAALQVINNQDLMTNVQEQGEYFLSKLQDQSRVDRVL